MRFDAQSPTEMLQWQSATRERLFGLMMDGKRPDSIPLEAKVLRQIDVPQGGYVLEEVTIQSLTDRRVHAWVAMPYHRKGSIPAVLALHGHGGRGEDIVHGRGLYRYGRVLAEMGYAVIAPDIGSHDLQHAEWTLMGERVWDAIRCIDYALSRPEVEKRGVGVAGLSLGGETAMYVAALDERVKVVDSSGWLTTVANMENGHCNCWSFPGLKESFDFSDIFSCIAPRALVCEIGRQEKAPGGFPVDIAEPAFEEIRRAYTVLGARDSAKLDIHPGGHIFIGREFWAPLRQALAAPYPWSGAGEETTRELTRRGEIARRAFSRSVGVLDGWWNIRDRKTNLIPRKLSQNVWVPSDNAADILPFLYLTAYFLAPERMPELNQAFKSERKLTNRTGALPDSYDIAKQQFFHPEPEIRRMVFYASEYCKDGLIPMTEVMGRGFWTDRMIELVRGIFEHAPVKTDFGDIPADDTEVNGEMLQVLCRLFFMTGDPQYLRWAETIGDAYCLEVLPKNGGLPAHRWDFTKHTPILDSLSLLDHGNEIIGGLSELMVASKYGKSSKAAAYKSALSVMFERLLAKGLNQDGIPVNSLKSSTGEVTDPVPPDTWAYSLSGVATFGIATGDPTMERAVRVALRNIEKAPYTYWIGADSFADSIEGGLMLLNRYPEKAGFRWLETVIPQFLAKQRPDGIVEGWYGDGNFARTALMAGLYYTHGTMCRPWRDDLRFGAAQRDNKLRLSISAEKEWDGRLVFDTKRHMNTLRLSVDYPRLNAFPEWYTVDADRRYIVSVDGCSSEMTGAELALGMRINVAAGRMVLVTVKEKS